MFGFGKKIKTLNDKEVHLKQTVLDKAESNGIKLFPKTLEFFNSNAVKYHRLNIDKINARFLGVDKPYADLGFVEIYRSNKDHGKIWNKSYDHIAQTSVFQDYTINEYMAFERSTKNGKKYLWFSHIGSGGLFGNGNIIVHMKDLNDMVDQLDSCWSRFSTGMQGGLSMFSYLTGDSDDYYDMRTQSWLGKLGRGISKVGLSIMEGLDQMDRNSFINSLGRSVTPDWIKAYDQKIIHHIKDDEVKFPNGEIKRSIGNNEGMICITMHASSPQYEAWQDLINSIYHSGKRVRLDVEPRVNGEVIPLFNYRMVGVGTLVFGFSGVANVATSIWFVPKNALLSRVAILKVLGIKSLDEIIVM